MKICVLALANPLFWVHHYIDAFREQGEVITIGPPFGEAFQVTCGITALPPWARPNDIETDLRHLDLKAALPAGWEPDLIVGISNFGIPLTPDMSAFDCPRAYLSIDAWQSPLDYVDSLSYDYTFVAQREFLPRMRAFGLREVAWLPLACSPAVHAPAPVSPTCDISFAGSLSSEVHHRRKALLQELQKHFTVEAASGVFGPALAQHIGRGKLTLNYSSISDVNMRVFESLAMGRCLLTNHGAEHNGLLDLFEAGRDLVVYRDTEELIALARRYLADEPGRTAIAEAGRAHVLQAHTYAHRVRQILDHVESCEGPLEGWRRRRRQDHSGFASFLPRRLGTVADFGLAFASEAATLRRCGMDAYIGLGKAAKDIGAWDRYSPWRPENSLAPCADTLLLGDFDAFGLDREAMLAAAHGLLNEGGALIARFGRDDFARLQENVPDLQYWMRDQGFHITHARLHSETVWIRAQKRSAPLRDLVRDALKDFDFDTQSVWDQVRHFPENM